MTITRPTTTTLLHPVRAVSRTRARTALVRRDERGLSTAEYAVGTLGACSIAGILLKIASSDWFQKLIQSVITHAFDLFIK